MSAGRIVVPLMLVAAALGLLVAGAAVPVVAVVALRRAARSSTTDRTRGLDAADRGAGRSVSSDAGLRWPPRLRKHLAAERCHTRCLRLVYRANQTKEQ